MSHPELLKKFTKLGVQGAAPVNPAEQVFSDGVKIRDDSYLLSLLKGLRKMSKLTNQNDKSVTKYLIVALMGFIVSMGFLFEPLFIHQPLGMEQYIVTGAGIFFLLFSAFFFIVYFFTKQYNRKHFS